MPDNVAQPDPANVPPYEGRTTGGSPQEPGGATLPSSGSST